MNTLKQKDSKINILQKEACNYHNKPGCNYTPGDYTNNVVGEVRKLLRDPDN